MNLLEKSRDFLKKVSGSQGKNINKIFGYLLIGIIILLASNLFLKKPLKETNINKKPPIISAENTYDSNINKNETKISLEKQLKETLSCIYGVGKVEVMMTLQSTDEIEPAYDITETIKKSDEEDA
ncbi:MAG TPA: hypothetical protein GX526_02225, partial [Thermoanaerobacterales bacterium]|nr:hypothetical protein [Thermoanaerobacterales bacterium]